MIALDADGFVLAKVTAEVAAGAVARGEAARTTNPAVIRLRPEALDRATGAGLTHRQAVLRRNRAS